MSILDDDDGKKSEKSDKGRLNVLGTRAREGARNFGRNVRAAIFGPEGMSPGGRFLQFLDAASEPIISGNWYNAQTGRGQGPVAALTPQNPLRFFGGGGNQQLPPAIPISPVNAPNGLPAAIPISAVQTDPRRVDFRYTLDFNPQPHGRGQQPALGFAPTIYNPGGIRGNTALSGQGAQDWLRSMQMQRGGPIVPWLPQGPNAF